MKLLHTIEYQIINDNYIFDTKLFTDVAFDFIEVEFEAEPRWENDGIGSYEFWGQKSFDAGTDYVSLEHYGNPVWNRYLFNKEENDIIKLFTDSPEFEKVCDRFCNLYSEQVD